MGFTHFDEYGKAVMVDVTSKSETAREATAAGKITVNREVFCAVRAGTVGKGDVLGVAATAGIMGAKRTSELIPMCHILPISNCRIHFDMDEEERSIYCECTVKVTGKTGVEMEALTGVSIALLTVYDMCKAMDKSMEIGEIYLVKKMGGKSGDVCNCPHGPSHIEVKAENDVSDKTPDVLQARTAVAGMSDFRWKAAVVTLSDKGYEGEREDRSGPLVRDMIEKAGYDVRKMMILPDDRPMIEECLKNLCDKENLDVIFTTGGTGLSERDCTPEATMAIADRNVPGIAEAMRENSLKITPRAMLSRGVSVVRGRTLIINLPGSPKAAGENLESVLSALEHGLEILTGRSGECGR